MSAPDTRILNSVTLCGRVSADPQERELPSGDRIVTFRLVVPRDRSARRTSRAVVDVIECVAWTSRLRAKTSRLREGDRVEVEGSLRRRFTRGLGAPTSWVSVEIAACTRARTPRE